MDKQNVVCPHNINFTLKRNDILTPATTRMNLEKIVSGKKKKAKHTEKELSRIGKSRRQQTSSCLGLGCRGERECAVTLSWLQGLFSGGGNLSKVKVVMVAQICEYPKNY